MSVWHVRRWKTVKVWRQVAKLPSAIPFHSRLSHLTATYGSMSTCYLSSSGVIASFFNCFMGLTFSTGPNVQIILDFGVFFFFSSFFLLLFQKRKRATTTRRPQSIPATAESYITFWVYGFLISRYSGPDDVTAMDPEHESNGFLEDIQYGCQETFDSIINIDNLVHLELDRQI